MSRGSNLHRTKEGRKKLNFTDKLKKKQDEKKYQKNQNQLRNNESSDSGKKKAGKTYTKAQLMAQKRIAQKKAGTYKKPKTAKELAKARLKIKKKK